MLAPFSPRRLFVNASGSPNRTDSSRHFTNLFEAPTLFYAVCLAAMVTHSSDIVLEVLAWLYVAARLVHSFIHLGRNEIVPRLSAYFTSWGVMAAMWISLALRVATAQGPM